MTLKRSELYGLTDFAAYCGGVLGLCLGFSFLSIVEIVYYITLRLWFNLRQQYTKKCTACAGTLEAAILTTDKHDTSITITSVNES